MTVPHSGLQNIFRDLVGGAGSDAGDAHRPIKSQIRDWGEWIERLVPRSPKDFGATGDGVTDDTAAVVSWIQSGGYLVGIDGTYLIAAAGPDSGGVEATISQTTHVFCTAGCVFKADTDLDNDILRLLCDPVGYTADRIIDFTWEGSCQFNQIGQKNTAVVPYSSSYTPANTGASNTADGLSIRGLVDNAGTKVPGFRNVRVSGVTFLASSTGHWESAGGDTGLFIDGARHIRVSDIHGIGNRDLTIYCSGLSGTDVVEDGSCHIVDCKFSGCMFGASTKRILSNVVMSNLIGYNTAVVATATDVTSSGDNVSICNCSGWGAWVVARFTGGKSVTAFGNRAFKLGHRLENGDKGVSIFGLNSACVRTEGTVGGNIFGNLQQEINTNFASSDGCCVRLLVDNSQKSENITVHGNYSKDAWYTVIESSGDGDNNIFYGNHGDDLVLGRVLKTGVSSVDRDAPLFEDNATTSHTGTTSTTDIKTGTVGQNSIQASDRLRFMASGTMTGTAGSKTFGLKVGSGSYQAFPAIPAATEGDWVLEAVLEMNSISSQRLMGTITFEGGSYALYSGGTQDFSAGDVDIIFSQKLGNSGDTVEYRTASIRLD